MQEEISVLVKNVPGSSDAARVLAIANKEIKDAIIERWADKVLEDNKMPLGPSLQALRPLITATSSTGTADGTSFFTSHGIEVLISVVREQTQTIMGQIHWFHWHSRSTTRIQAKTG